MSTAHASLNNLRTSPRKVRLVANYMRGKTVEQAANGLKFLDKRAAEPMRKLLESAVANAKNLDIPTENLFIKEIRVDSGATLFRRKAGSRGRAMPIRKRTSKIHLMLAEKEISQKLKAKSKTDKVEDAEKKPKTVKKAKVQK